MEVTKVTKDLISIAWKAPKYDGGSEITMYILEARMIGKDKFTRLTKENLMDRKYTYDGLREGDTYEFRVIAVNEVGPSKPSFCTKPVTCKDELGKRLSILELDYYWQRTGFSKTCQCHQQKIKMKNMRNIMSEDLCERPLRFSLSSLSYTI